MEQVINSILSRPKTYLPLFVIVVTWISDSLFPSLGLPVMTPEVKEMVTVLMAALAVMFLRQGTVKVQDMSILLAALTEQLTKEIKQGTEEQRKKATQEQLQEITKEDEKTLRILQLISNDINSKNNTLEEATQRVLAAVKKK